MVCLLRAVNGFSILNTFLKLAPKDISEWTSTTETQEGQTRIKKVSKVDCKLKNSSTADSSAVIDDHQWRSGALHCRSH